MKIAIVILNWNGKHLLEKFLPSIISYSTEKDVAIYVADNASTDSSVSYLKENFPTVHIVQNTTNGGYAKGYNEALQHIEADIYALVNSDIEVTKNWLQPIYTAFKNEPNTAIIQPKICDYKNKLYFEYAGAAGGYVDMLGYPFCRGRIFGELEQDTQQYNDEVSIFWASGACFFVRAEIFKQLNGFDEDYFAHQEEIDLCWRVQNLGKTIKYMGNTTVYHVGGATLKEESPRKTFLNFRNSLFSLIKNVPTNKIIPIIFARLLLDGVAGLKFLLELRPIHTLAIIKAHASFYYFLPKMLKKRKRSTQKNNYYYTTSIVWQHYIKRKKIFKELR